MHNRHQSDAINVIHAWIIQDINVLGRIFGSAAQLRVLVVQSCGYFHFLLLHLKIRLGLVVVASENDIQSDVKNSIMMAT